MDVFPESAWCGACGGMCFSACAPGVPSHSMCVYAIHPPTQELNCVGLHVCWLWPPSIAAAERGCMVWWVELGCLLLAAGRHLSCHQQAVCTACVCHRCVA